MALVYGLLAYFEIALTRGNGRIAALWIPNAVVVAAVLLTRDRQPGAWLLACSTADFVANILVGDAPFIAAGLTIANVLEIVLVCWTMRRWCGVDIDLTDVRVLAIFGISAGLFAPALSGLLATSIIGASPGGLRVDGWLSWWLADALGLLIATPTLMLVGKRKGEIPDAMGDKRGALALFLSVTGIATVFVFSQNSYPFPFVVTPFVIVAAFRFGPVGTALTIILISVISLAGTALGNGPIALLRVDDHHRLVVLQFFLAINVGIGLPVAAALETRERMRRELLESRNYIGSILESMDELAFRLDKAGHITFVNAAFERTLGIGANEARGRHALSFTHPDERDAGAKALAVMAQGRDLDAGRPWRLIDSQGAVRILTGNLRRLTDSEGNFLGINGCLRDITEKSAAEVNLKQVQSELIHMSRLSAMGVMAATLAHELNQPLAGVTNYARGLRRQVASNDWNPPAPVMTALHEIDVGASRAGEIVRRLRNLVERNEVDRKQEPLPQLIREACAIALIDAKSLGIRYLVDLDPNAKTVFADRIQIQQVLVNLLRNAVEALDGQAQRNIHISTTMRGNMCEIGVHDSGPGVPEHSRDRLFASFNTTKESGMGIGLSISRTIIEANGGKIWYEPGTLGGATFRMTLLGEEEMSDAA